MKRLIPYLILLVVGGFLFGCLPFTEDNSTQEDIAYEFVTYEGLLQSLGSVKFNPDATHLLRLDDDSLLYVYSDFYNLWDTIHLNQSVEVSGLLIPGVEDDDKAVLAIEQLTVLEEEEEEETIEINMETYTSESLGFAIGYQSDWEIEEHTSAVEFTAPQPEDAEEFVETDLIQVSSLLNKEGLGLEEWVLAYQDLDLPYTKSVISPDQIEAIKIVDGNSLLYYVAGGERTYMIMHLKKQDDFELAYSNLFNEVLLSFDLLEDGARAEEEVVTEEVVEETEVVDEVDEVVDEVDEVVDEVDEVDVATDEETDYETVISSLADGDVTLVRYEFVEPDYIYMVYYSNDGALQRDLLRNLGGGDFEVLATFDEGSVTDWVLTSGVDEAKGQEFTTINADTGESMVVLEGYRALESATLQFQMQYPSSWYYSRAGSYFYFSNEPADATNALVTLEIKEETVSVLKTWNSSGVFLADVPRDDESSYRLSGDSEYQSQIETMAGSIQST